MAAVAGMLAVVGCAASPVSGPSLTYLTTPTPSPATAEALMSGQWSTLPRAPIASRDGASILWTGSDLLVWGGASGADDDQLHSDGAAYDPATGLWHLLPAAPLSPRVGQAAVWTGKEMIVWGGYDYESAYNSRVSGDGAAYDPATGKWQVLPQAPLSARGDALAVWTGAELVLLGGQSGATNTSSQSYGNGAAYDPATGKWQKIPAPDAPEGHPLVWRAALEAAGELLAWSEWGSTNTTQPNSGVDLFAYHEQVGQWDSIPVAPGQLPDVEEVFWTGEAAVVRGAPENCGVCSHPPWPESTSLYDPEQNHWSALPPDPLGLDYLTSIWTGDALLSFNSSGTNGDIVPGDASVWDPITRDWEPVPAAPFGCDSVGPLAPVWTGHQVILYCTPAEPSATVSGLVLSPGE